MTYKNRDGEMIMRRCIFCEKEKDIMVRVSRGYICIDCVLSWNRRIEMEAGNHADLKMYLDKYYDSHRSGYVRPKPVPKAFVMPASNDILAYLNVYVAGQEDAKAALTSALIKHYLSMKNPLIKKSNIFLIGPSGSGKTYLVQSLAKAARVPFAVADASSLTAAGYVGNDVDSMLLTLYTKANYNLDLTEKGIIFIDEIDKLAKKDNAGSVGRESVQQELLKMIEGDQRKISISRDKSVTIDTSNILFICGGSFAEQYAYAKENGTEVDYGLIPEFLGRFSEPVHLNRLMSDDLVHIMSKTKNNVLEQQKNILKSLGVDIHYDHGGLKVIADYAIKKNLGARGLKNILDDYMQGAILFFSSRSFRDKPKAVIDINEATLNNAYFKSGMTPVRIYCKPDECWYDYAINKQGELFRMIIGNDSNGKKYYYRQLPNNQIF